MRNREIDFIVLSDWLNDIAFSTAYCKPAANVNYYYYLTTSLQFHYSSPTSKMFVFLRVTCQFFPITLYISPAIPTPMTHLSTNYLEELQTPFHSLEHIFICRAFRPKNAMCTELKSSSWPSIKYSALKPSHKPETWKSATILPLSFKKQSLVQLTLPLYLLHPLPSRAHPLPSSPIAIPLVKPFITSIDIIAPVLSNSFIQETFSLEFKTSS